MGRAVQTAWKARLVSGLRETNTSWAQSKIPPQAGVVWIPGAQSKSFNSPGCCPQPSWIPARDSHCSMGMAKGFFGFQGVQREPDPCPSLWSFHPQNPKSQRETSLELQIPERNFSGTPNPGGKLLWSPKSQRESSLKPQVPEETSLESQIPEGNFTGTPNPRRNFSGAPNPREKLLWNPKSQRKTSQEPHIPEGNFSGTPNPRGKCGVVLSRALATKPH